MKKDPDPSRTHPLLRRRHRPHARLLGGAARHPCSVLCGETVAEAQVWAVQPLPTHRHLTQ